jgi:DNA adenine methylase
LRVQIENAPAVEVIKRYDSEETLFYRDPSYPHGSRGDSNAYANKITDEQHRELAEVLRNVKGKVALSSYHSLLMDELYGDWQRVESKEKIIHSVKTARTEVLWINYKLKGKAACQPVPRRHTHSKHPRLSFKARIQ